MPGFNAGTVVEPLDYDFRTKETPNAPHGTIKEPNDKQIAAFYAGVKDLIKEFQDKIPEELLAGTPDIGAVMAALDDFDTETIVRFHQSMAGIFAALCSGSPTKAQMLSLAPRIRNVFYAWLQREVMAPEVVPGGGSAEVVPMRPAAAG